MLPRSVIRHIRDLVDEAVATGAHPDDVIDVLRLVWRTATGTAGPPEAGEPLDR